MSTFTLPDPIAAYFAADKLNADAVARCFMPQGVVVDEGRTHVACANNGDLPDEIP